MNLEKITMPFGLLKKEKPKVAQALEEHFDAGKPVEFWSDNRSAWARKPTSNSFLISTVYRAAPGSTDRKPKKPKVTPLVVTDWGLLGDSVGAVSKDEDGWINLHGEKGVKSYSGCYWAGNIIARVPPDTFPFIDPGTCDPEDSLVWREGDSITITF